MKNLIFCTDSYKYSHYKQYPPNTIAISAYIESRGGEDETVFFGLQAFLKEYLSEPITLKDVDEAEKLVTEHGLPFNRQSWIDIVNDYDGYLPLLIKAVKEGTVLEPNNVQVQIENIDPRFYWLPSFIETSLLRAIWYPSTVATKSRKIKKIIIDALNRTSDIPAKDTIYFKLHDFGARGASSSETAMLGGMGHLVNFKGTDTIEAIVGVKRYYGSEEIAGYSIPASEHSTITSWGRDHEYLAFKNMIESFGGEGKIYACVSDSYNIYDSIYKWKNLESLIKEKGGTLVIRPDSGDPLTVPIELLNIMGECFGYTVNNKGYKVLPDHIRLIQGDGINEYSLPKLIENVIEAGFSIDNIAFGMGGGLLQHWDRDTLKYAMKTSAIITKDNYVWRDVFKDPIHAGKKSKKGRLFLLNKPLVNEENVLSRTTREDDPRLYVESTLIEENLLKPVYYSGKILSDQTFDEIRELSEKDMF